ncbi:MAG: rod shape-determining protein MreD [Pseudomonadota bacterium]|jgi:rod shape-determining protein MreD
MRLILTIVLALVMLLAQGLLHHFGIPAWLVPQALVACVVFVAFHECSLLGVITAFILGLLLDMNSAVVLGPWAGAYVLVYAILVFLSQRLFIDSMVVAMTVVGLASLLAGGVFLMLAFEYQSLSLEDLYMLGGQSIASALVAPLVFAALSRIWKRLGVVATRRGSVVSAV